MELLFFLYQTHNSLLAEEEATALSTWAVGCMCGTLRLENAKLSAGGDDARKEREVVVLALGAIAEGCINGLLEGTCAICLNSMKPGQGHAILYIYLILGKLFSCTRVTLDQSF
ncbi:uncharacterized protein LOC106759846 [Vigna radiata var. radiata]|uniref:Uncharacterized protein LOC106759846 n=1 Tax=Vigna radiata var. radiata TaxID=3916 RepID=A0A3Q0F3T8_VIGRR|nr:uncharacterized protein LOC106759846 [Vigna radiata var. radiata]